MATKPPMTLSSINHMMIKTWDSLLPQPDVRNVRNAQTRLVKTSLRRFNWEHFANDNTKHRGIMFAPISGGIAVFAVNDEVGLVKPWFPMPKWEDCVPSSPSRLRLMDVIAPSMPYGAGDVESGRPDELILTCRRDLLRDGVVGPVSEGNASQLYEYLFKGGVANGRFVPASTITTHITYAVSYKHEREGDTKMSKPNFFRIVRALKAVHPFDVVYIWIDQQLRKCPDQVEWINRGVAPFIAFPTVRLGHYGEERVWISIEKTAAAKHCVRIDIPLDPDQITLVVNTGLQYPTEEAVDAVAGFLCGELVTTFGVTYKEDLRKLRDWAKCRFQSLTTPQLCSVVNYGTRAYFVGGRRCTGAYTAKINCWSPTPLNSVGLGRRAEMNYKGQRLVRAEFNTFVLIGKAWRTTMFLVRLRGRHVTQFVTVDSHCAMYVAFVVEEYGLPCNLTRDVYALCDNGAKERVGRILEVRAMSACELDG